MFEAKEFEIFGFEHLFTIGLIIGISILLPIVLKTSNESAKSKISIVIAAIILVNELKKPFYYHALYPDRFVFISTLPLHLCNLASIFIAIYLIFKIRFFFSISFFWGISGCLLYTSPSPRDPNRSRMPSSA